MSELELFHVLRESECDLTVLKMKVKGIDNPVIGTVDRIVGKSEIILKPYTLYGEKLTTRVIKIANIEKLVKVHLHYSHLLLPIGRPQQTVRPASKATRNIKGVRRKAA
ncbi:MAG TPA: hypothetical protein VGD40_10290 [Chryseosolibacter sp.]